jgi:hypothetical protein
LVRLLPYLRSGAAGLRWVVEARRFRGNEIRPDDGLGTESLFDSD